MSGTFAAIPVSSLPRRELSQHEPCSRRGAGSSRRSSRRVRGRSGQACVVPCHLRQEPPTVDDRRLGTMNKNLLMFLRPMTCVRVGHERAVPRNTLRMLVDRTDVVVYVVYPLSSHWHIPRHEDSHDDENNQPDAQRPHRPGMVPRIPITRAIARSVTHRGHRRTSLPSNVTPAMPASPRATASCFPLDRTARHPPIPSWPDGTT
jgi:hypothetical protein